SLMIRDFAPLEDRMIAATARLNAIREFLDHARTTLGDAIPAAWTSKALNECEGAGVLVTRGIELWLATGAPSAATAGHLRAAAARAKGAFVQFCEWLATRSEAPVTAMACGSTMYDLLLARGHACTRTRAGGGAAARSRFAEERHCLDEMAESAAGSWAAVQEQLAADH